MASPTQRSIYFACSIRGGRKEGDESIYFDIVKILKNYGDVPDEEIVQPGFIEEGGKDKKIHDDDVQLITDSDILVAEVTKVSMGVGYEIGRAVAMDKKILCLYNPKRAEKKLSAMVRGAANDNCTVVDYSDKDELESILKDYFEKTLDWRPILS